MSSERSPKPLAEESEASALAGGAPAGADSARALEPTAAAHPSEPDEWTGRVLDERYRVLRLLGEGGMGAVFVAEHLTLHKQVALKVVRAELAGNGEVAARFAREAMATAQFEHPHVASAIDYGTLPEGGAYFVMQLVRGRSLRALLATQKMVPWRRVCELMAQVADALSAAKAAGIIHRDLKPDNVLVERREDGSDLVKVLDFGIAHVAPRDSIAPPGSLRHRELTRVGTVMGTPGYMSPEQAVGDKVDHRADLYALGVVLWECVSGRELWDGPDLTTVVTRQMTEPVPRLRDLGIDPTLPVGLDELVQRLTANAAADRPEHAAEVRDELRRLAQTSTPRWSLPAAVITFATPVLSRARPQITRALTAYRAQPPAVRGLLASGAIVLLLTPLAFLPAKPAAPPSDAVQAAAGAGAGAPATSGAAAAPEPASMIDRVVRAASDVVQRNDDALVPAPPKVALPKELTESAQTLIEGKTLRERRTAANKILAYKPADRVYPYLRVIAQLEIARSCKARKALIASMEKDKDSHYLPTLRRLDRSSRSGCGFLGLGDCISCVRPDVREALDAIELAGAQGDPHAKPAADATDAADTPATE